MVWVKDDIDIQGGAACISSGFVGFQWCGFGWG